MKIFLFLFFFKDMAHHVNDLLLSLCFCVETVLSSVDYYQSDRDRKLLQKNAATFLNAVLFFENFVDGNTSSDSAGSVAPQNVHGQGAQIIPASGLFFDSILADRLIRLFYKESDSKAISAIMAQVCTGPFSIVIYW